MTRDEMRALGVKIHEFIAKEATAVGCDPQDLLGVLLSAAFVQAERAGLAPKKNPRALFERAALIWDRIAAHREEIATVEHLSPKEIRDLTRSH